MRKMHGFAQLVAARVNQARGPPPPTPETWEFPLETRRAGRAPGSAWHVSRETWPGPGGYGPGRGD
jgi:hypothetical protein